LKFSVSETENISRMPINAHIFIHSIAGYALVKVIKTGSSNICYEDDFG
jgi:hypothetical protein